MSLLSELKTVADACSIPVETGVFSGVPPDLYLVITPMADTFELHADDSPGYDTQEARLSLFVKGSYTAIKDTLVRALLGADFALPTAGISPMRMIPAFITTPLTWRNYTNYEF